MAVTWRDTPVFLTWQARLGPLRREWNERFVAEVRRSDRLDETASELEVRLRLLAAELGARADVRAERLPNPALMVRLVALAPNGAEPEIEIDGPPVAGAATGADTWWQRLAWPDDAALPVPGELVSLAAPDKDPADGPRREVVSVRPTFEPGWIEVELRHGS